MNYEIYTTKIRHHHTFFNWSYIKEIITSTIALKLYTAATAILLFIQYLRIILNPFINM